MIVDFIWNAKKGISGGMAVRSAYGIKHDGKTKTLSLYKSMFPKKYF
jgi:hypothetical protein